VLCLGCQTQMDRAGGWEECVSKRTRRCVVALMRTTMIAGLVVLLLAWKPISISGQADQAAPAQSSPPQDPQSGAPPIFKVEVIETTPLPGLNLKPEQVPAPVQTAVGADIEASGALDLSSFLNRRFNGVFVNELQNNPFQPDLNYRGYTASP